MELGDFIGKKNTNNIQTLKDKLQEIEDGC